MCWYKTGILFLIVGLSACQPAPPPPPGEPVASIFDMAAFIDQEISELKSAGCRLSQKLNIEGKEEVGGSSNPNWASLLKPFKDSDINKSAWIENYKLEKSEVGGNTVHSYKTSASNMRTQELRVAFEGKSDQVISVDVSNVDDNFILRAEEKLRYYKPERSFEINKEQQYFFFEPQAISIKGSCK